MARSTYFYHEKLCGLNDKYSDLKHQIKAIYIISIRDDMAIVGLRLL